MKFNKLILPITILVIFFNVITSFSYATTYSRDDFPKTYSKADVKRGWKMHEAIIGGEYGWKLKKEGIEMAEITPFTSKSKSVSLIRQ